MKNQIFTKFYVLIGILFFCLPFKISAQERQNNFQKMRNNDFTRLIGGIQEGVRLNYNSEKTNIEGSIAKEIKKSSILLQGVGSIGTTTNISSIINQNTLPTYSGSLTTHFLIRKWSIWYYDGSYIRNYKQLQDTSINVQNISTKIDPNDNNEDISFVYKDNLKEKVINKIIKQSDLLYTFKRFYWTSLTAKYDNNKYSFYDASRIFSDQISEPIYNSWTGKVSFNAYFNWNKTDVKWKPLPWRPNFIYLSVSVQYGLGNNIQQLRKVNINDIVSTSVNGTSTRQIVKNQNSYNGTFKEFRTVAPSLELIFSPIRSIAINVFGEYNAINNSDKIKYDIDDFGSIAAGLYFYGNGSTSKINIGAFYKWTKNNSTNSWTEQIGLRTSIPITPLD